MDLVHDICPSGGPMLRPRLPSTGSLGDGSPASTVLRLLRLPLPPSAQFPLPPVPRSARLFATHRVTDTITCEPGRFGKPAPSRHFSAVAGGLPGSWVTHCVRLPCSPTPVGTTAQANTGRGCCRRWFDDDGPPHCLFRGCITQLPHSLSTLRSGHCWTPRKTRFRLVANLFRAGFGPAGSL